MSEISAVHSYEDSMESPLEWKSPVKSFLYASLFTGLSIAPFAACKKRKYALIKLPTLQGELIDTSYIDDFPRCSDEEKEKIQELFETLAKTSLIGLANPITANKLYKLGKEIENIHTFAFLSAFPKKAMQTIFRENRSLKTSNIIQGVSKGILKEPHIERQIPAFAKEFQKDENQIRQLIRAHDWKRLLGYLFEI